MCGGDEGSMWWIIGTDDCDQSFQWKNTMTGYRIKYCRFNLHC